MKRSSSVAVAVDERTEPATAHSLTRLRAMIVTGELAPGEQVRQQEMADLLGISRVPLCEALNVLADQGLLLHRRNQGYFVAKRGPDELRQFMRMLQLLENELLLALDWPNAATVTQLRGLNREMAECVNAPDWTPIIRLNREFHFAIFSLAPQRLILKEVERLWALAEPSIAARFPLADARKENVVEHRRIIAALVARDRQALLHASDAHRGTDSQR